MQVNQKAISQEDEKQHGYKLSLQEIEEAIRVEEASTVPQRLRSCCLRQGCEDINSYKYLNKIHEGTYGVVYRALEVPTGRICAVKKLKIKKGEDFPITSLRQISILRGLDHNNIIKVTRVAGSPAKDKVYIVMQYLDHEVKQLLKQVRFRQLEARRLIRDLLEGIDYLHDRKIVHRDLKTSNLLYSNQGILKICDFGLARKATQAEMTQQVITMWYRPPQLLLGKCNYSVEVDIWSVGIIMAEIFLKEPPFRGKSEIEQLDTIFKWVGSPNEKTWPQVSSYQKYIYVQGKRYPNNRLAQLIPQGEYGLGTEGIDLLKNLLTVNPKKRISAKKALAHSWLKGQTCPRENMPKWQPLNELDRVKKKIKREENQRIG